MGSFSPAQSPSRRPEEPPSTTTAADLRRHRIYLSFCSRDQSPNTTWIDSYDPSINAWERVTAIPGVEDDHLLKDFGMVALAGSIYIVGGRLCPKIRRVDATCGLGGVDEVCHKVLSTVLRYDVRSNEWSECAPLKTPRFDFACVASDSDGKIYVAGGKSSLTSPRGVSTAEVYDAETDAWRTLTNMSARRHKCVGVMWGGKVHVVGGFAERADDSMMNSPRWYTMERCSADVYNPKTDTWTVLQRMWQLDVPPNQIVPVNGNLFSSGDCLNAWKGHIEAYDNDLNFWNVVDDSKLRTLACPVYAAAYVDASMAEERRMYLTIAPIGTQLYFLVGYRVPGETTRSTSIVHVFDTKMSENGSGGWRSFEPVEEDGRKELCSHCCVVTL
ncbi:F-box/kelch-repeat protein At1g16250 [Linum grandiflorum]